MGTLNYISLHYNVVTNVRCYKLNHVQFSLDIEQGFIRLSTLDAKTPPSKAEGAVSSHSSRIGILKTVLPLTNCRPLSWFGHLDFLPF